MTAPADSEPRLHAVRLPGRGGGTAVLDFGPPNRPVDVVFSHANGFNARTYRTVLAPLGRRLRILAPDLRGHGGADLPTRIEGRDGWSEFRDDLLALLQAEAEAPVVLAGHSMGATASLLAAAAAPERVRGLALFDPVIFDPSLPAGGSPLVEGALRRRREFPDRETAFAAYRGRGAFRTWDDAQLADYLQAGLRPDGQGGLTLSCTPEWEASNYRSHNYDPFAAFAACPGPVRLFRAETGSTVRLGDREAGLTADGRLAILDVPGTTHFLPLERPDLVRQALAELAL